MDEPNFIRGEARISIDGKPVRGTASLRLSDVWESGAEGEPKSIDFSRLRIVRTFKANISLPTCCPFCNIGARAAWGIIPRNQG